MWRKIRVTLAVLFFVLITFLFLDFTGSIHVWFGWMAKLQFLPAIFAFNVGVILFLVVLTLVAGRVYCSIICPLGVLQDIISWISGKRKKKKYRFSYSPAKTLLRYSVLILFIVALLIGFGSFVALLAPYSAYGRIVQNLFAPIYGLANNTLALWAERINSYAFYQHEIWLRSLPTFIVACVTLVMLIILAWRNGRTYCNTICPVGTILGLLARCSLFRPMIDDTKCNKCGLCARKCKAACIDSKNHKIDHSRCVTCMDCLDTCKKGAISYTLRKNGKKTTVIAAQPCVTNNTSSRRNFLSIIGLLAGGMATKAQEKIVDGGFTTLLDKQAPDRSTPIAPPGALGLRHLATHCTGCQLCVSVCPNYVLRPSVNPRTLMQPELSYEKGYCRPECTKCSQVCPAGAIIKIDQAEKSSIQIGHAVWIEKNCIPLRDGVSCGSCARHCPTGAITMVSYNPQEERSPLIPVVNEETCIGCGACENLCPSRPFSAIYVEGHEMHKTI